MIASVTDPSLMQQGAFQFLLFGLMLIFWPLSAALALVTVMGVLAVIFAIGLFGLAWRLRKAGM